VTAGPIGLLPARGSRTAAEGRGNWLLLGHKEQPTAAPNPLSQLVEPLSRLTLISACKSSRNTR